MIWNKKKRETGGESPTQVVRARCFTPRLFFMRSHLLLPAPDRLATRCRRAVSSAVNERGEKTLRFFLFRLLTPSWRQQRGSFVLHLKHRRKERERTTTRPTPVCPRIYSRTRRPHFSEPTSHGTVHCGPALFSVKMHRPIKLAGRSTKKKTTKTTENIFFFFSCQKKTTWRQIP